MAGKQRTVIFSREGITVQEEREAPLTEGTKTVPVEELDWESFPTDLLMQVTDVEPVPHENDDTALSELRFTVSRLERPPSESSTDTEDDFWAHVETATGISKQNGNISLSGDKNVKNNMTTFVKFLYDHGYLTKEDLPVKSGWKRYLINTEPVHQQGGGMSQEVEVADSVFVETKFSRNDARKHIAELAGRFGE